MDRGREPYLARLGRVLEQEAVRCTGYPQLGVHLVRVQLEGLAEQLQDVQHGGQHRGVPQDVREPAAEQHISQPRTRQFHRMCENHIITYAPCQI